MSAYHWREDAETWRCFCPGCDEEEYLQVEAEDAEACILWCRTCASTSELRPGILITPVLIEQGADEDDQRKPPTRLEVQMAVALERGKAVHELRIGGRTATDAAFDLGIPERSARRCLELYYTANPDVRQCERETTISTEKDDLLMELLSDASPHDNWGTIGGLAGFSRQGARHAYQRITGLSASNVLQGKRAFTKSIPVMHRDLMGEVEHAA